MPNRFKFDPDKGLVIKTPLKGHNSPRQYAMAHPSVAHTYGNVALLVAEHIKEIFPPNFFKTVHVNTTIAYKQLSLYRARNKEFFKKGKPMLIIRPRIDIEDTDVFLYGTLLTERMSDLYYERDYTNLQPFFEDKEKGVEIKYLLNRLKMLFDISIITETMMEQINISSYLRNSRRVNNHPYFIPTSLESLIPYDIIRLLSKEYNIPIKDDVGNPSKMIDLLNTHSCNPITYKNMKSTGNDEFFRYYQANIETIASGVSIDDGDKIDFVMDTYTTQYTISTEFFGAGMYLYYTYNNKLIKDFQLSIATDNPKDKIIPLFTVKDLYEPKNIPLGWTLFSNTMYQVDDDATEEVPDILPLKTILNDSIEKVVSYHKQRKLDINLFMKFRVLVNNQELEENIDFIVDLDKNELITRHIEVNKTYRLLIYINRIYINELIKREFDLD